MRLLIFAAMLVASSWAVGQPGQYSFTVLPANPIAETGFQIRVTLGNLGCVPLPTDLVTTPLEGNVIRYELHVPDSCFPFPPQERIYSVEALPAGHYSFQLAVCPQLEPPPPVSACSALAERSVTVFAQEADIATISSLTPWGLSALLGSIALLGLAVLRRR